MYTRKFYRLQPMWLYLSARYYCFVTHAKLHITIQQCMLAGANAAHIPTLPLQHTVLAVLALVATVLR